MYYCCDFNLVINPDKYYFNYLLLNNTKARKKVLELILAEDLVECLREDHLKEYEFTWRKKNNFKQARLDPFSSTLYAILEKN